MMIPWGQEHVSNKNSIYEILIDSRTIVVGLTDTLPNYMFVTHNRMHTIKIIEKYDALFS
jgi:hypothetical protein